MVDVLARPLLPPARPPTPPRERTEQPSHPLHDEPCFPTVIDKSQLDTPIGSPTSSAEYFCDEFGKLRKRVDFSPWNQYYKPTRMGSKSPDPSRALRPLPPSRERKSAKSILKCPADNPSSIALPDLHNGDGDAMPETISTMMDALTQSSRTDRLEAYVALQGRLGTLEAVTEPENIGPRLDKVWQGIGNDIIATNAKGDGIDVELVISALRMFLTLLSVPAYQAEVPSALRQQMTKQALAAVQTDTTPATVANQYMQILARPAVLCWLTTDQVQALFSALDKVVRLFKGNRILMLRIMSYQGLAKQNKASFIAHTQWIDHLIAGVSSSHRDLRTRAISLGSTLAFTLGTNSSLTKEWAETLNRRGKESQTVFDFLTARMRAMIEVKDESSHVPQIWSMVTLFHRGRPKYIERWEHLKPWLAIIQKCFNATNLETKSQANLAWDKLVFAISPDLSTSQSVIGVLCQPIISQLDRNGTQKQMKQSRISARSSLCNLLYYALRPGTNHEHLDLYWDRYVSDLVARVVAKSHTNIGFFCKMLKMLFTGTPPRSWEADNACRCQYKKPDQLPSLDPKWARSRVSKILAVFQSLDVTESWQPDGSGSVPIETAWQAYMQTIGLAASKEIKVSMDSMNAVAAVMTTIKRMISSSLVDKQDRPNPAAPSTYGKIKILIDGAILGIGHIPFNERRIVRLPQQVYEAAETPSSRSGKSQGALDSPVYHMLSLLISKENHLQDRAGLRNLIDQLVTTNLRSALSRSKEIATLRSLTSLPARGDDVPREASTCLWEAVASLLKNSLLSPRTIFNGESPPQVGHEYRDCVKLLDVGVGLGIASLTNLWEEVLAVMNKVVVKETCIEAANMCVVEPLAASVARALSKSIDKTILVETSLKILHLAVWPSTPQAMDRAYRMLWGSTPVASRPSQLEPFEHLYVMLNEALSSTYQETALFIGEQSLMYLDRVGSFIMSCPKAYGLALLEKLGPGVNTWIADRDGKITRDALGSAVERCRAAVNKLWLALSAILKKLDVTPQILYRVDAVFAASLGSRQRSIANDAISLWNETFGALESVEYSDVLTRSLKRVSSLTDLSAPGLTAMKDSEEHEIYDFVDSPVPIEVLQPAVARSPNDRNDHAMDERRTWAENLSTVTPRLVLQDKSPRGLPKPALTKTPPKAKLRHNDSQIQFAAIDSSPVEPHDLDSQRLTDRQKEVKERQNRDAATLFSHMNSSPLRRTSKVAVALPRLSLSQAEPNLFNDGDEDDSSFVFPSADLLSEENLGSSPTPSTGRTPSDIVGIDVPSSPPATPSFFNTPSFLRDSSQQDAVPASPDYPDKRMDLHVEDFPGSRQQTESPIGEPRMDAQGEDVNQSGSSNTGAPTSKVSRVSTPPSRDEYEQRSTKAILSESDVFMDAPTDHITSTATSDQLMPSAEVGDDSAGNLWQTTKGQAINGSQSSTVDKLEERGPLPTDLPTLENDLLSQVTDSMIQQSGHSSDDDDRKVQKQLAFELEFASSQTNSFSTGASSSAKATKKRKSGPSAEPSPSQKRRRGRPPRKTQGVTGASGSSIETDDTQVIGDHAQGTGGQGPARSTRAARGGGGSRAPSRRQSIVKPSQEQGGDEVHAAHAPDHESSRRRSIRLARSSSLDQPHEGPSDQVAHQRRRAADAGPDAAALKLEAIKQEMIDEHDPESSPFPTAVSSAPITTANLSLVAPDAPSTAAEILAGIHVQLEKLKRVELGREEERAFAQAAFEIVQEAHEAGRRRTAGT